MKKIFTLITFALVGLANMSAQDCVIPNPFVGNTGNNMTIMLTPALVSSLTITESNAYIVALTSEGMVVGSKDLFGISQTSLALWGNDTSTDEVDGAVDGELIIFQLVNGTDVYDIEMPESVNYIANGMVVQMSPAIQTVCSAAEDILGCMDVTANNYNADANVDDGCTYDISGCMDADANNYNADANVDDASCTYDTSSGTAIEYQLSAGWNMVGYTGTADNNGIVEQMDAALGNSAGTANTFQVIKNVSGQFWSAAYAQISTFNQGQGYMMYVNGATTTVNFQLTSGYISGIEYALSAGWNMVAFTGDVDAEDNIVSAMDAALGNSAGTANTFEVIKNVSGQFWSAAYAQITTFNPGQAYMMYVIGEPTSVNFQQE